MERKPLLAMWNFVAYNNTTHCCKRGTNILAKIIAENTLIYLDPPFSSSRNYNILFKDEHGIDSEAQIVAGKCIEE